MVESFFLTFKLIPLHKFQHQISWQTIMKKAEKTTRVSQGKRNPEHLVLPGKLSLSYQNAAILLILTFTFLLYAGALRNDFMTGWDDGEYLTAISGDGSIKVPEIFSNFHLGMYQPLSVLSMAINYKLSGPEPRVFILTNILLHLLNTFLIFRLTERWMKGWVPAAVVALLFAIHPMHVEPVVWISARSSGLYSLFFLLGLIAWDKYADQGYNLRQYLYVLLFFILALFSKSMAATFPVVLLMADYLKKRQFRWSLLTEKIPFFVISIIFGLVAIRASASFGHITVLEQDYNLFQRFFLILYSISFYILKLFVPLNLSAIYAFPEISGGKLPPYVFSTVIVLIAAIALILYQRKYRREFLFGGIFFLITIGMVLPLFWSRIFITADRYTYIPYIGLFIIIGRYAANLWETRNTMDKATRRLMLSASLLLVIILGASTVSRISVWKNTPTLLSDVIDKKRSDADMAHAYFYLGNYYDAGNNAAEALKYYDLSLSRNPAYLLALNNRGILKGKAGQINSAITDFEQAIRIKPDYAEAWYNRGIALFRNGDLERACNDWKESSRLGFAPAHQVIARYCDGTSPPGLLPMPEKETGESPTQKTDVTPAF